jgi:hypothetical protein
LGISIVFSRISCNRILRTLVDHLVPDTRVQGHRLACLPLQSHEGRASERGARRKVWRRERGATYRVLTVGGGKDGLSLVVVEQEKRGRYPARRRIAEGVGEGRGQTFGEQAEAGVGGGGRGTQVGDGVQALRQALHTTVQAQGLTPHRQTKEIDGSDRGWTLWLFVGAEL